MNWTIWKAAYLAGYIFVFIIRFPYYRASRRNKIVESRKSVSEKLLLFEVAVGTSIIPLIYVFWPWLSFADYRLPEWASCAGVLILAVGIWLLWHAHKDLGRNWFVTLQIRKGHTLVTTGVYRLVRHPMYASAWLWVICQPLLLHNWLAGFSGVVSFGIFYLVRSAREEQMMLDRFGDEYREYMKRTGRVFPRTRG
jgi:protein-S-isoprenylcysteine O-methyltransferase Ste14